MAPASTTNLFIYILRNERLMGTFCLPASLNVSLSNLLGGFPQNFHNQFVIRGRWYT